MKITKINTFMNDGELKIKNDTGNFNDKVAMDKLIQIADVIELEKLSKNSVVVLKLGGGEDHKIRMHAAFMQFLSAKKETFQKNKVTVLFLNDTDDLKVISESDMNKAGWFKKEKSLIINPFQK